MLAGQRILVVEDEMLVLMAIEDMLADLGCTSISVAASVDKALRLIETEEFDLATVDVNLNGTRSYPVAQQLAQRGVPFAFSTGYGEHGIDEGFGGRPVLNKPYSPAQFVAVLAGLLNPAEPPTVAA